MKYRRLEKLIEGYTLDDLMKAASSVTTPPGVSCITRFEDGIEGTLRHYVGKQFPDDPNLEKILEDYTMLLHIGILMAENKLATPADHTHAVGKDRWSRNRSLDLRATWKTVYGVEVLVRNILAGGDKLILVCDGNCQKAWGITQRPREHLSDDEDDVVFLADGELGKAPKHPGTSVGFESKPQDVDERLNRWCYRECERSSAFKEIDENSKLRDWSKRRYNQPWKHGITEGDD